MASAMQKHPEIADGAKSRKDIANTINKMQANSIMTEISNRHEEDDVLDSGLEAINNKKPIDPNAMPVDPKLNTDEANAKHIKTLLKHFIVADTFATCDRMIKSGAHVHLVEIDPPYAIDYTKVKQSEQNTDTYTEIAEEEYYLFMKKTLETAWALLSDNGWVVCWYAISKYHDMILRLARGVGFTNLGIPSLWTKPNSTGQNNQPTINLSNTYETFFILRKGKAFLNKNARANEFRYPGVKKKTHATEKPVELYQDIFTTLVPKGSHIVSMFVGSGAPLVGGFLEGMQMLGIDSAKEHKVSYEGLLRKYMKA
jgi:DNA modification methylase